VGGRPQRRHRAPHLCQALAGQLLGVCQCRLAAPGVARAQLLDRLDLHVDDGEVVAQRIVDLARQAVALTGDGQLLYVIDVGL